MDILRTFNWKFSLVLTQMYFIFLVTSGYSQISPGQLARPHAQLEGLKNCIKCHTLGAGPTTEKCLSCHVEIQYSIKAKHGYHYQVLIREKQPCSKCHSEHNGRNFKLIFWPKGQKAFDHDKTGFFLEGKHSQLNCRQCHQAKFVVFDLKKLNPEVDLKRTFLGLGKKCLSCHEDEHHGQLAENCLKCHNYREWKPAVKFNHARARFILTGKHRNVACEKCHPTVRATNFSVKSAFVKYTGLPFNNCTPCHRDVHNNQFGQNCKQCHRTSGWNQIIKANFDHSLTRFPLRGQHRRVACVKCHVSGKMNTPLKFSQCSDCHRDVHFGQFLHRRDKGRCESCHDVFGFVPAKFNLKDHAQTRFPLTGAHVKVACRKCHPVVDKNTPRARRIFRFSNLTCNTCHQDIHKGQFAHLMKKQSCERCHKTTDWHTINFDHNKARFVLTGKHVEVACNKCHKRVDIGTAMERILFRPMNMACAGCHKDVHFGQFNESVDGTQCERCHTSASWQSLLFEHNRDSLFKLTGAHVKVPCEKCHKLEKLGSKIFIRYKPIDRRCVHCHG
ncbi:MAG: cytochrome C [Calditrichaeota bacterium]|nr:MAG: cytochrome C [Calditrichota bacterium]